MGVSRRRAAGVCGSPGLLAQDADGRATGPAYEAQAGERPAEGAGEAAGEPDARRRAIAAVPWLSFLMAPHYHRRPTGLVSFLYIPGRATRGPLRWGAGARF